MAPRETEINAYAKFWGDKQRALWYVMVFLEWSITLAESTQNAKIKFPGAFLFIVFRWSRRKVSRYCKSSI